MTNYVDVLVSVAWFILISLAVSNFDVYWTQTNKGQIYGRYIDLCLIMIVSLITNICPYWIFWNFDKKSLLSVNHKDSLLVQSSRHQVQDHRASLPFKRRLNYYS